MSDEFTFNHVCSGAHASVDVIFVHGLTGDPQQTWQTPETKEFWPEWLCEDVPEASVYTLGYPASVFAKWAKKEMDLHERAVSILEYVTATGLGTRPIIFVAHSLGGLLVKEILRTSNECRDDGWRKITSQTKFVAFLATPHLGAELAAILKFAAAQLISHHVEKLSNDTGFLKNLNDAYRDIAAEHGIETIAYFEKYKTKGAAIVVSAESADPGAGSTRTIAVDSDHVSICKPAGKDSLIYSSIRYRIENVVKNCAPIGYQAGPFADGAEDDYAARAESDRRTLQQKLIDAEREHEYSNANDMQNKFAQKYRKLGLYNEEKTRTDYILQQVEQRFVTHVYHAKICKGASDEEILKSIQENVIDTLCNQGDISERLNPKKVYQAIYYLTEQCYLRWDAA